MARALVVALLTVAFAATGTTTAQAWSVNTRVWLKPQITYSASSADGWQAANYAAWVWRRTGARFVPVRSGADVTVRITGRCGGDATVGFRRPAFVRLGNCPLASRALLAVHEFGHVLGLSHEDRYCSRMNSRILPGGTPARCARRSAAYWVRHPLERDDLVGGRWIVARAKALRAQARAER